MKRIAALVLALLALAPAAALGAGCPQPKTSVSDLSDEVMCPVCGTPLNLAEEAPQAERQRALIQRLVDECRDKDEIKDVLKAEFGDNVLALPGGDGFGLAAYLVPGLGVLLGGAAVGLAALRWRRRRPADDRPTAPAPDPEAAARLEDDLDRYER